MGNIINTEHVCWYQSCLQLQSVKYTMQKYFMSSAIKTPLEQSHLQKNFPPFSKNSPVWKCLKIK